MNSSVLKSLPEKDCIVVTKSHRKSRRKPRKGFKNSNIKKKKLKNLCFTKKFNYKANFFKKFTMNPDKTTSNWYWSNYKKAFEWQDKHKIAHWKSCALALLEENRCLIQIINNIQPGLQPKLTVTHQNLFDDEGQKNKDVRESENLNGFHNSNQTNFSNQNGNVDEGNSSNTNDEIEFEMSEEMIKFFEESYKHKMQMKQMKEKEALRDAEQEVEEIQSNKIKRKTEMEILYGEGASMITGMETAVQLSFDKYCDTKSPKYWPNIPFRL